MRKGEIGTIWSNGDFDVVFSDDGTRAMCFRAKVDIDFEVRSGLAVLADASPDAPTRITEIRVAPKSARQTVVDLIQASFARA
jgi:hypothetical protein